MNITYKELTKKDYPRVKELIRQAWFSEYDFKEFYINQYTKGYIYHYLSFTDFRIAAWCDGKLVGFLLGQSKNKRDDQFINKLKLGFLGFSMLFTKVGRRGIDIHLSEEKANKKMKKEYPEKLNNQLGLFIVDKVYRNHGIGTMLEDKFYDYLRNQGESKVYLYTDIFSNYQHYEHHGYKRSGTKLVEYKCRKDELDEIPEYYIYVKEL